MSRERLYARIDERVDRMVSQGLVEEVSGLARRGLTPGTTAGQAIGYKEVLGALAGETTLDEAVELVKLRSRRYAKRQLSWLRRAGRVRWLDLDDITPEAAARAIVSELGGEPHASI